ncbi:hypothetical protein HYX13_02150 [Candidatus Woesearchaeota archaeon]|nr:hypothetical protein [Candidatus Woesearchaeota archaeon]
MGIQEYITKLEDGKMENDTVVHDLFRAYIQLEERLVNEKGLIDRKKLKGKEGEALRKDASKAAYEALKAKSLEHYGATTTDAGRQEDLVFGLFGFYAGSLDEYLEQQEENVNAQGFLQYIAEKTPAFRFLQGQRIQVKPQKELKDKDAEEVVKYTKTEGMVDSKKLGVGDMAELLNQFIEGGVITPNFLKGKDYRIKDEEKKKPVAEEQRAAA